MDDRDNTDALGILARRRIEAAIIAPIYEEMRDALGVEKAQAILRKAIRRAAIASGAEMAKAVEGAPGLEGFKAVFPLWTKDGRADRRASGRRAGPA